MRKDYGLPLPPPLSLVNFTLVRGGVWCGGGGVLYGGGGIYRGEGVREWKGGV